MQQLVILLVINCSSTCFGRLYAHHQEVRLRYTAYGYLYCCNCCDVRETCGQMCALYGGGCLSSVKQPTPHSAHSLPADSPTSQQLQQDKKNIGSENAVWPPDDGRKDARNMLRNNWLPIKLLIVASSWSHLYLLIKDARSFENKIFLWFPYS